VHYRATGQTSSLAVARRMADFLFGAWEGIHVECSSKYDTQEIEHFASAAGFSVVRHLFDSQRYFVDSLWQVRSAERFIRDKLPQRRPAPRI
jgi:uncharacterized SAM-dependent methyltransferase